MLTSTLKRIAKCLCEKKKRAKLDKLLLRFFVKLSFSSALQLFVVCAVCLSFFIAAESANHYLSKENLPAFLICNQTISALNLLNLCRSNSKTLLVT